MGLLWLMGNKADMVKGLVKTCVIIIKSWWYFPVVLNMILLQFVIINNDQNII